MDSKAIKIGYGGTLNYRPSNSGSPLYKLKKYLWTYSNDNINASTRSGFYLIRAIQILKEKHQVSPKEIQIIFWGDISKNHFAFIQEAKVEEFFIIESALSARDSLRKLGEMDLCFLPLEKSATKEHETLFIPGKLFEYLELRKPILALCEASDCERIIKESGLGFFSKPDDEENIAQTLLSIIKKPELISAIKPNEEYINSFRFKMKTKELALILDQLN
jgi:glycosyltransferase involved in cell wall biosynthesis